MSRDEQADFVGNRGAYAPPPRQGASDDTLLKVGVVVAAYFLVVKPLMAANEEEKKREDEVKKFEEEGNKLGGCNPFDYNKFFDSCTPRLKYGFDRRPMTTEEAAKSAKKVYDGIGYIYDEPDKVIAGIKACRTKTDVAYLSKSFDNKYQKDMWTYIKKPLSDKSQKKIIDYVNGLPDYIEGSDAAVRQGNIVFLSPTKYKVTKAYGTNKVGDIWNLSTTKKIWEKE